MLLTMMIVFHKQRVQNDPKCFNMFQYLTIRLRVAVVVVPIFLCSESSNIEDATHRQGSPTTLMVHNNDGDANTNDNNSNHNRTVGVPVQ